MGSCFKKRKGYKPIGTLRKGMVGFGYLSVNGLRRVPRPAANKKIFKPPIRVITIKTRSFFQALPNQLKFFAIYCILENLTETSLLF